MPDEDSPTDLPSPEDLSPGDNWPFHYRGYGLSANQDGTIWWQAYNGTDRLKLKPNAPDLADSLLGIKRNGGAFHVTEGGSVITRVETGGGTDEYETVYIGSINLRGKLTQDKDSQHAVSIKPNGLEFGDIWPSVYDGAKYSFNGDQFWWQGGDTHLRHPLSDPLPSDTRDGLRQLRPHGGSFRITPNGDVLTQIPPSKTPMDAREQFQNLPRPIKRILQLRRDRTGVNMIPVYVGHLGSNDRPIEIEEPVRLTDPLTEQEASSLEAWVAATEQYEHRHLDRDDHRYDNIEGSKE